MNRPIIQKENYFRSKKYLDSAEGRSCIRCGRANATIVACHYTGIRQHTYAKGFRVKCHDICTADFCSDCHRYFDNPMMRKSIEASEEFLHYIMLTILRRIENGIIKL
jgi:hypothetical protein